MRGPPPLLEEPGLLERLERSGAVAQIGDAERRRVQLVKGHFEAGVSDAGGEGVLPALTGGDDRLGRFARQVGEEALGIGLVLARLEDARGRDVDQIAGIPRGVEVEGGVNVARPDLVEADRAALEGFSRTMRSIRRFRGPLRVLWNVLQVHAPPKR